MGGGKLSRRREQLNALGGLTFLTDSISGTVFLVDTGASVSVLPHRPTKEDRPHASLRAADGNSIPAWGTAHRRLLFGDRLFEDVPFTLAGVDKAILGADFFRSQQSLSRHRHTMRPGRNNSPTCRRPHTWTAVRISLCSSTDMPAGQGLALQVSFNHRRRVTYAPTTTRSRTFY